MALSKLTVVLNKISTLATTIRGQASTVKAAFDHDVNEIKDYINNTLTTEIDALDSANIKKTGDQTIDGVKTFVKSPIVPTPTTDTQASTKKYVDDAIGAHKTELSATTDSNSGADKIGVTPIPTLAGGNAQTVLESIKDRLDNIGATNTNVELSNSHYAANGQTYASVGARADSVDVKLVEVDSSLAQIATEKATKIEVAAERARIDEFTHLAAGSTTGDAELIDARVGADGEVDTSAGTGIRRQFNVIKESIGFIYSDNPDINLTAYKTILPGYIESGGAISGPSASSTLTVVFYAVKKGRKYIIHGKSVRLAAAYPIVGFTTNQNLTYDGTCSVVLTNNGTLTDYNEPYIPTEDGYVIIAKNSNYNTMSIANAKIQTDLSTMRTDINVAQANLETLEYTRIKDADLTGTTHDGYYLYTDKALHTIGGTSFKVVVCPVEKDTVYKLYATGARINSALPMVGFGVNAIGNLVPYSETIIEGSATPTNIDMEYTPSADGYIFIACYESYPRVVVATTKIDSIRISNIEKKLAPNGTLKIQLFGDSITDNLWGDLTTWANYIQAYIPKRTVTVVNCAVGGGGIGHGKSTTTPSQQDKTYNYVYDLVTDGVTLDTAANVIVILVGTNDWAAGLMNIGAFGDTGYSTLYGCLKGIIEYISTNTSAKLFICTIPQRYNTADQARSVNSKGEPINDKGYSLRDFCKPIIEMCEFYGIPCIDLNKDLGWNRINISKFSADRLHPNTIGDVDIATFICNVVNIHMVAV